ncbi:hypothetical protein IV203_005550 [Nitzschia inconspicua]|uniref:Uncharacterized protein n=1 Tax=Nitzschia inconspicua TaxID=303405 RepID=A0A9K3PG60_9STRA|nr:hypothetical protein IV203_005550 [Nitzschia inconspicua]
MDKEVTSSSETADKSLPPSTLRYPSIHNTSNLMSAAAPPRNPNLSHDEQLQKRRFAVFVKILFRELDRSEDRAELREVAKAIVLDCTRRNRLGDPAYRPLMNAVDQRLRRHVGETHWRRAHLYLQHYMKQDALRRSTLSTPVRTAIV